MAFQYQGKPYNQNQGGFTEVDTPFSQQQRAYDASAAALTYGNAPSMPYQDQYDDQWYEDEYYEDEEYGIDVWQAETFVDISTPSPHLKMAIIVAAVICIAILLIISRWIIGSGASVAVITAVNNAVSSELAHDVAPPPVVVAPTGAVSPLFAPSVLYWEDKIVEWANNHNLDPDMVATIMQIESCGDPQAVSSAGAQGLFQVMPYHFADGEVMTDPDTNAYRGMKFLAELMVMFNGDTGLSMAGYNGGPGNAKKSPEFWPAETQRYHTWGTGIYSEVKAGNVSSQTLQRWLDAGGASLCRQAAVRLGIQ